MKISGISFFFFTLLKTVQREFNQTVPVYCFEGLRNFATLETWPSSHKEFHLLRGVSCLRDKLNAESLAW